MTKKSQNSTDIVDLITKLQGQLTALERKVDVLVSRGASRPPEARTSPQACSSGVVHAHPDVASGARFSEPPKGRPMYQIVCADCKKDSDIPFKPTGDRPVYCKECFQRRRAARTLKPSAGQSSKPAGPALAVVSPSGSVAKAAVKKAKKPAAVKKPVAKKKPAAAKKKK